MKVTSVPSLFNRRRPIRYMAINDIRIKKDSWSEASRFKLRIRWAICKMGGYSKPLEGMEAKLRLNSSLTCHNKTSPPNKRVGETETGKGRAEIERIKGCSQINLKSFFSMSLVNFVMYMLPELNSTGRQCQLTTS